MITEENFYTVQFFSDKNNNNQNINNLSMNKTHLDEYFKYAENSNYIDYYIGPFTKRCIDFIRLFGIKGFTHLIGTFLKLFL